MRTRKQLADTSGLTVKTLGEIERADRTSYDPATLAIVERALQWSAGTIAGMRDDGRPPSVFAAPAEGFTVGRALDALVHPSSDLSERDRQAIRDGMRALLHLGEQAMIAHAAKLEARGERPVDVPVLDATERSRERVR